MSSSIHSCSSGGGNQQQSAAASTNQQGMPPDSSVTTTLYPHGLRCLSSGGARHAQPQHTSLHGAGASRQSQSVQASCCQCMGCAAIGCTAAHTACTVSDILAGLDNFQEQALAGPSSFVRPLSLLFEQGGESETSRFVDNSH